MNLEYDRKESAALLKKNKKVVALFTQMITLFVLCCTFFLNAQDVLASDPYYVDYAEPSNGENCGYLIIEYASGKVGTFCWSAYSQSEYTNDVESIDTSLSVVIDEQKIIFTILTDNNIESDITNQTTYYTITNYSSTGSMGIMKSGSTVDKNPTHTYTTSGTIVGFTYKGNVSLVTNQLDSGNSNPIVVFGDDLVGQYVHEIYSLIGLNSNALQTYLPMLNKIQAWESRNNEQLELLVSVTNDILSALDSSSATDVQTLSHLSNISKYLSSIDVDVGAMRETLESFSELLLEITNGILADTEHIDSLLTKFLPYIVDMNTHICNIEFDVDEMKPVLNNLLTVCENLYDSTAHIESLCLQFLPYIVDMNTHICNIEYDVNSIDNNVSSIDRRIEALSKALTEASNVDKEAADDFKNDSLDQTNMLNGLNQQVQVDKPNVDDMSNAVDDNLNVDIDANYGVLLSAFTSNNRILTMLLIVASVSLVSYVLFGKR